MSEQGLSKSELLAQVAELQPAALPQADLDALRDGLTRALLADGRSRYAAALPAGTGALVDDLTATGDGGSLVTLRWTLANRGDYDQNGEVNLADITPLGTRLGKDSADSDWLTKACVADGDGNGEVNLADITPIGLNFFGAVTGYRIEATVTPGNEASWQGITELVLADGSTSPENPFRVFTRALAVPAETTSYRVRPLQGSNVGIASNVVEFVVSNPPAAPIVDSVSPLTVSMAEQVQFSAVLSGGAPNTYSWDFGTLGSPQTSSAPSPLVTIGNATGDFVCSLTVENVSGEHYFPFTVTVDDTPVAPVIENVSPNAGNPGTQVPFEVTCSGGQPDTWNWNFGGGAEPNITTEASPLVTLGAPGSYNCQVNVSNLVGADSLPFTLIIGGQETAPIIWGVFPGSGQTGVTIQFATDISGGTPTEWEWDFGGAGTPNTPTEPNPFVELGAVGTYDCMLTVRNSAGEDTELFTFEVLEIGPGSRPSILFIMPMEGTVGEPLTFDVHYAAGSPATDWDWEFGGAADPNDSSEALPTITPLDAGEYSITLIASNEWGLDIETYMLSVSGP